jgi:hypothetical protein
MVIKIIIVDWYKNMPKACISHKIQLYCTQQMATI